MLDVVPVVEVFFFVSVSFRLEKADSAYPEVARRVRRATSISASIIEHAETPSNFKAESISSRNASAASRGVMCLSGGRLGLDFAEAPTAFDSLPRFNRRAVPALPTGGAFASPVKPVNRRAKRARSSGDDRATPSPPSPLQFDFSQPSEPSELEPPACGSVVSFALPLTSSSPPPT